MAENNMQVLIEGFDPSKVETVNNFDKDWKEVYGAYQNNSIIQAPIIGIEKLLDKPCAVVGNIRGFIPLEFTGAAITLKKIDVDDEIIAVVRSVSPSLIRADIGGIEVKIPLEEIRYGWIDDLTEEVKQGDHLKVKVLEIDKEEKKVTVSAKALQDNSWLRSISRYTSRNEYVGTVSGVREYGMFIRWPVT